MELYGVDLRFFDLYAWLLQRLSLFDQHDCVA